MTHETYYRLVSDALAAESEEMFISAPGWADWMDEYGEDTDRLASDMRNIYQVSHMTMLDLISRVWLDKGCFFKTLLDLLAHRGKLGVWNTSMSNIRAYDDSRFAWPRGGGKTLTWAA